MRILEPTSTYDAPLCVALGFFDCVHLGHAALLESVKEQARSAGATPCVLTFCNDPYPVLGKDRSPIFTFEERLSLLSERGITCVLAIPFTAEQMEMRAETFLQTLSERFCIRGFVCGHDHRFGKDAEGTPDFLREFCTKRHIMCDIVQPVMQNNVRVSSTQVRRCLQIGDIEGAERLMGHAYFIRAKVCRGRGVGRLYDFPTANLACDTEKQLPACGVYATVTEADGKPYVSVTNVGDKPTFGETGITVETLLHGFSGDLYGKTITVRFVRYLRAVQKFDSPLLLRAQIQTDMKRSEENE